MFSCEGQNETEGQQGITLPSYFIDNNAIAPLQDCTNLFDLRVIEMSKEASLLVGGAVKDFIPLKDRLVLVDRLAGRLTAIGYGGEVLWQVKSTYDSMDSFTSIFTARFNPYSQLIEVFDDNTFTVYRFNESGAFVSKRKETTNFLDRVSLSDTDVVYDMNFHPKAYLDEEGLAYDFAWSSDGLNIVRFKKNNNYDPNASAYVTHDNFSVVGDKAYHRKSFFDTIHLVKIGVVTPAYTLKCKQGESAQSIITDSGYSDKVKYIMKESVPFIMQSVPVEEKIYSTYRNGRRKGFHIVDDNGVELLNTFYLKHEDRVFPAPVVYRDGYFFSMLFDSQLSEINEMKSDAGFPDTFSAEGVNSFSPESDLEKMTLYVFSPK